MPDIADENASLEDSRTTMVNTSERSTPESEADRFNIIETRYRALVQPSLGIFTERSRSRPTGELRP